MTLDECLHWQAKLVTWICSHTKSDPRFYKRCEALTEITRRIIRLRNGDATEEGKKTDWIPEWASQNLNPTMRDIQEAMF